MNCKSVRAKLSAYLDRELAGSEMLLIREHISACRACRAEVDEERLLKSLLSSMTVPEPTTGFEERLLRHVRVVAPAARRELSPLPLFSAIAAAAMVLTLLALSTARGGHISEGLQANERIESAIQRDQIYAVGGEPFSATPVISTSNAPR